MALDLKELESQMDVKKALMVQQLKNRSKIGKYSATMLTSMQDTAHSLAGTGLRWIDGEWQGDPEKKVTPKSMLEYTRILELLENRTAKYLEVGYDELQAVGAAKVDLQNEGLVTQNLKPVTPPASVKPPLILSTVPAPASVSPTKIPEGT
jgi:hypothetical protein